MQRILSSVEFDDDPGAVFDWRAPDVPPEKVFRLACSASGNAGGAACISGGIEPIAGSGLSGFTEGWLT
ncbi:hypothetical protein [Burkholderia paludis]|uniref:hypothetical protein n=1 Tax=Burkholderia paludis TaxID=1506587 RepID=UPI001F1FEBE9|nr:hypothetical protein [Burkholderia paludis]